jgi:hypothetical protein
MRKNAREKVSDVIINSEESKLLDNYEAYAFDDEWVT